MEGSISRQMERWEEYGRDQFSLQRLSTVGSDVSVNTVSSSLVEPRTLGQYQEHLRAPTTKSGAVELRIISAEASDSPDWIPCWALLEDSVLWFFAREDEEELIESNRIEPFSVNGNNFGYELSHNEILSIPKDQALYMLPMTDLGSIRTVRNKDSESMLCLRCPDVNYYIEAPSPEDKNDWLFHFHQTVADSLIRQLAKQHRHHRVNSMDDHYRSFTGVAPSYGADSSSSLHGRFSPLLLPRRQRSASTVALNSISAAGIPLPPLQTVDQLGMEGIDDSIGAFALDDYDAIHDLEESPRSSSPLRRDSVAGEFHFATRDREPPIEPSHHLRKSSLISMPRRVSTLETTYEENEDGSSPSQDMKPKVVASPRSPRTSGMWPGGGITTPTSAFRAPVSAPPAMSLREALKATDTAAAAASGISQHNAPVVSKLEPKLAVAPRRYIPPQLRKKMQEEAENTGKNSGLTNDSSTGVVEETGFTSIAQGNLRSLAERMGDSIDEESDTAAVELLRSASEMEYPDFDRNLTAVEVPACASCVHPRGLKIGVTEEQGCRKSMEDYSVAIPDLHVELGIERREGQLVCGFFGVYDGHCGTRMAEAAAEKLHVVSSQHPDMFKDIPKSECEWPKGTQNAVNYAFATVDKEMSDYFQQFDPHLKDGSCCITAILKHGSVVSNAEGVSHRPVSVTVANLGDSRAVLCRNGTAVPLSFEHSPCRKDEQSRIEAAGGWITEEREMLISRLHHMDLTNPHIRRRAEQRTNFVTIGRVNGELAVSRALGDVDYKLPLMNSYPFFFPPDHPGSKQSDAKYEFSANLVSSEPEWITEDISEDDSFIIIACDGLWDALDPQEAVDIVRGVLERPDNTQSVTAATPIGSCVAKHASDELVTASIRLGTSDNVTCMVIIW